MKTGRRASRRYAIKVPDEDIRYWADYQINWDSCIDPLHQGRFKIESADFLSIHGDAPKNFIYVKDYVPNEPSSPTRYHKWPAYIAKVGSKWYPVESVTEQLITRIGQVAGVNIADSQLRIVGRQVRFLSKFFLDGYREWLSHGIEIFKLYLDDQEEKIIREIANNRMEREFYTFQTVCNAIYAAFPEQYQEIMAAFVEMIAFDAVVGNNDRHPANWGVIVPIRKVSKDRPPRFSPVFDTARALLWNSSEQTVRQMMGNEATLQRYIRKSYPQIGWDLYEDPRNFGHFDLIERVYRDYPAWRHSLLKFTAPDLVNRCEAMMEEEFRSLLSLERRTLIAKILQIRHSKFCDLVS